MDALLLLLSTLTCGDAESIPLSHYYLLSPSPLSSVTLPCLSSFVRLSRFHGTPPPPPGTYNAHTLRLATAAEERSWIVPAAVTLHPFSEILAIAAWILAGGATTSAPVSILRAIWYSSRLLRHRHLSRFLREDLSSETVRRKDKEMGAREGCETLH
jgi:hypothetical protein